jgi:hypothetical protein
MEFESPDEKPTKMGWERTGNVHEDLLHLFETGDKADCAFKVGSEVTGFEVSGYVFITVSIISVIFRRIEGTQFC